MPQTDPMSIPAESLWPELIAKFDHPLPRYTSYPPIPTWSDDPASARRLIFETAAAHQKVAMYVHVPFCSSLCYYCACNRYITKDTTIADRYLDALELELDDIARRCGHLKLAALHWGGGTPNSLTAVQIGRLFRAVATRFDITRDAEISIEVDPRQASENQIAHLGALGFNRLSAGVQDFNVATQRAINRFQTLDQTMETIAWARDFGMREINVDVIYGLPYQTRESFALTLEDIRGLQPDTVAVYAYAHVPWINQAQRVYETALPNQLDKFGMLVDAIDIFHEAGYVPIGIDHFALPDSALGEAYRRGQVQRTFMGYTPIRADTLLAVGASAISASTDAFSQNVSQVAQYCGAANHGGIAQRGCLLNEDDLARKAIIESLMTYGVVTIANIPLPRGHTFSGYFAENLARLRSYEKDGLVAVQPQSISLTQLGRLFARNVSACFDTRTTSAATQHASAV
jgi:oxygen-independent coproporphyrinogen III oxidase